MQPEQYPLHLRMEAYIESGRNKKEWSERFLWNAVITWKSVEWQAFDLVRLLGASCRERGAREKVGQESRCSAVLGPPAYTATALCHTHVHTRTTQP